MPGPSYRIGIRQNNLKLLRSNGLPQAGPGPPPAPHTRRNRLIYNEKG
jgi:hypothetical protein